MLYALVFAFIVLDFCTGVIKALKQHVFTSSIMREGLFHKIASLSCIILAVLMDYAQAYIDLGIKVPITNAVCAYIILMEVGSIIENVGKINPKLIPSKLRAMFLKIDK